MIYLPNTLLEHRDEWLTMRGDIGCLRKNDYRMSFEEMEVLLKLPVSQRKEYADKLYEEAIKPTK